MVSREKKEATSLPKANTSLLKKLSAAVNGQFVNATFACGGSVPVTSTGNDDVKSPKSPFSPPVTIRWDRPGQEFSSKTTFPLPPPASQIRTGFGDLLARCQPATFGVGGTDVLDENYRKAGKLDNADFSTNFHPHNCGILDAVQQILLPSTVNGAQATGAGPYGVRAEVYKLNVCLAPPLPHLAIDISKSIQPPVENSSLKLTLLAVLTNSARLLFVCLTCMKAAPFAYSIVVKKWVSAGRMVTHNPSPGPLFTVTVSMKCWR